MTHNTDDLTALHLAEHARINALLHQDFDALKAMLDEALVHIHTRGNRDTRDGYLHFVSNVIEVLDLHRGELHIRLYGDYAVMHGRQTQVARLRRSDERVVMETNVRQAWRRERGRWILMAFQATLVPSSSAAPLDRNSSHHAESPTP